MMFTVLAVAGFNLKKASSAFCVFAPHVFKLPGAFKPKIETLGLTIQSQSEKFKALLAF
jgi:hypothetical protein